MINEKMITLVVRLLEKSEAGDIDWREDEWNNGYQMGNYPSKVIVTLEDGYSIQVYNSSGMMVDSITQSELMNHSGDSDTIRRIFHLARRKARNADETIDNILNSI